MMASWMRKGGFCICIDENWHDFARSDVEVAGPAFNEICVISDVKEMPEGVWLKFPGDPYSYEATAFRPLSPSEKDALTFNLLFTEVDIAGWHEEPA